MVEKLSEARLTLLAELGQTDQRLEHLNSQLRKAGHEIQDITWVLQQLELRRKGHSKLGDKAADLFFTRNGLEQASRWPVARYHADRLEKYESVTDLGCGLGIDSLAFLETGLDVVAVEQDPETAELAKNNLSASGKVLCGRAEEHTVTTQAVFLDPARRDLGGRFDSRKVLGPADFSPSLDFAYGLLNSVPGGIKLAPGLPYELIPESFEACWVSHNRDLVELSLWNTDPERMGKRFAVMLTEAGVIEFSGPVEPGPEGTLSEFIYEPDPSLIRSSLLGTFAKKNGLTLISKGIAYLSGSQPLDSNWLRRFRVLEELPLDRKAIRRRMAELSIGRLEIKKRGVDIDPAALRKELKLKGEGAATLILTRVGDARKALVCTES